MFQSFVIQFTVRFWQFRTVCPIIYGRFYIRFRIVGALSSCHAIPMNGGFYRKNSSAVFLHGTRNFGVIAFTVPLGQEQRGYCIEIFLPHY